MKGVKGKSTSKQAGKSGTGTSSGGQRNAGTGIKNSKEQFLKKLNICMKHYDYKDETKDVRGKTERLNTINEL